MDHLEPTNCEDLCKTMQRNTFYRAGAASAVVFSDNRAIASYRYFPCTVEWFLERSRLVRVAKGWKRKVLEVLVDYGMLDGSSLAQEQQQFNKDKKSRRRQFLQLELEPCAREGQPVEDLNKVSTE